MRKTWVQPAPADEPIYSYGRDESRGEAGFGAERDRAINEGYRGGPGPYARLEVYKAMRDPQLSVWGFVQHAKGNPAEDFWSYGLERLGRSRARMGGADFGRHLGIVRDGGRPRAAKRVHRVDPERKVPDRAIPENG